MVKSLSVLAENFYKRAQSLPTRDVIQPVIEDIVDGMNLNGAVGVTAPVEVQSTGPAVYVYFQIDVKQVAYQSIMDHKLETYDGIRKRIEDTLSQHFPMNQFHVSFGYFPKQH